MIFLFGINDGNLSGVPLPRFGNIQTQILLYPDNKIGEGGDYVEYGTWGGSVAIYKDYYVIEIDPVKYRYDEIIEYLLGMIHNHIVLAGKMRFKCFMSKGTRNKIIDYMADDDICTAVKIYKQQRHDNIKRSLPKCLKKNYDMTFYEGREEDRKMD